MRFFKIAVVTICAVWFVAILLSPKALAGKASFATNIAQDLFIGNSDQSGDLGQLSLSLFISYYLNSRFAINAAFETDLESSANDPEDRAVAVGGTYLLAPLYTFCPFLKGETIVLVDPDTSIGFRFGSGLKVDLFSIFGVDGIYVTYQFSVKGIYAKDGGPFHSLEFYRVGFEYAF